MIWNSHVYSEMHLCYVKKCLKILRNPAPIDLHTYEMQSSLQIYLNFFFIYSLPNQRLKVAWHWPKCRYSMYKYHCIWYFVCYQNKINLVIVHFQIKEFYCNDKNTEAFLVFIIFVSDLKFGYIGNVFSQNITM